jgi:hypothetical protein
MVWRVFQYESLNDIVRAAGTYVHYKGYSQIDYSKLGADNGKAKGFGSLCIY